MLQRILPIVLAAAAVLSGCALGSRGEIPSGEPEEGPDTAVFAGEVLENHDASLLVLADEDSPVRASSDRFSVSLSGAELEDSAGNPLAAVDFTVGSRVEVTFGGVVAESYPAQISDVTRVVRKEPGEEPSSQGGVQLPNPMVPYDSPDFTEAAGFQISALPQVEEMTLEGCWLIGGSVAQLKYRLEMDTELIFRAAVDTGEDVSGVYQSDWEEDVIEDTNWGWVRHRASAGGPALVTWSKDGYFFSMYFPHPQMGMAGGLSATFLEEVKMTPALAPGYTPAEGPADENAPSGG